MIVVGDGVGDISDTIFLETLTDSAFLRADAVETVLVKSTEVMIGVDD